MEGASGSEGEGRHKTADNVRWSPITLLAAAVPPRLPVKRVARTVQPQARHFCRRKSRAPSEAHHAVAHPPGVAYHSPQKNAKKSLCGNQSTTSNPRVRSLGPLGPGWRKINAFWPNYKNKIEGLQPHGPLSAISGRLPGVVRSQKPVNPTSHPRNLIRGGGGGGTVLPFWVLFLLLPCRSHCG